MSGEDNSVQQEIKKIEDNVNNYLSNIGIPLNKLINTNEIKMYLGMTRDEINKMSPTDCGEIAVQLAQAAFYIQKTYNVEKSKWDRLNLLLNRGIAKSIVNFDKYLPAEIRKQLAVNEDAYLQKLQETLTNTQMKIDSLEFMSGAIKHLCHTILELQQSKRYK